jgi:hypothetical protein
MKSEVLISVYESSYSYTIHTNTQSDLSSQNRPAWPLYKYPSCVCDMKMFRKTIVSFRKCIRSSVFRDMKLDLTKWLRTSKMMLTNSSTSCMIFSNAMVMLHGISKPWRGVEWPHHAHLRTIKSALSTADTFCFAANKWQPTLWHLNRTDWYSGNAVDA